METSYSNRIQGQGGVRPLSTALKVMELLALFADSSRPLRLPEIAKAAGISRPTAYQRLATLQAAGMLEQDDAGGYRLSMFSVRLAAAALDQADIGTRAEPVLHRLSAQLGETVSLSVLDRGRPCIVARVECNSLLRAVQEIGTVLDLQGSASGRVLSAFADDATLGRLVDGGHALPDDKTMEKARRDGWAVSSGYTQSGVIGFATPVRDGREGCRAALSVVMPEQRFNLDVLKEPMLEAADDISTLLQGRLATKDTQ